jgi:hypothetical protein
MVDTHKESCIPNCPHNGLIGIKESNGVLNYTSIAMELIRGNIMRGAEWDEWRVSEWKNLANASNRECLEIQCSFNRRRRCFVLYGHIARRCFITKIRQGVHMMD